MRIRRIAPAAALAAASLAVAGLCAGPALAAPAASEAPFVRTATYPVYLNVPEGVECGADGPAGKQDVIDQHDDGAVDVLRDGCRQQCPVRAVVQIVAVQGDIQAAHGNGAAGELLHGLGDPPGQRNTAGWNAQEDDPWRAAGIDSVFLNDLVRNACDRARHVGSIQKLHRSARIFSAHRTSFPASLCGI